MNGSISRAESNHQAPRAGRSLLKAADLAPGSIARVDVGDGIGVAVYNVDGDFFATVDRCTHGDAELSDGELDGDIVICPFHEGAFCVRTGEAVRSPCWEPVRTIEVWIEGDMVMGAV